MLRYVFNPYTLVLALVALLVALQFQLWFGEGGVRDIHHLNRIIVAAEAKNAKVATRNQVLKANIDDLKHGQAATEEQARTELGMVKPNETYYQIVGNSRSQNNKG